MPLPKIMNGDRGLQARSMLRPRSAAPVGCLSQLQSRRTVSAVCGRSTFKRPTYLASVTYGNDGIVLIHLATLCMAVWVLSQLPRWIVRVHVDRPGSVIVTGPLVRSQGDGIDLRSPSQRQRGWCEVVVGGLGLVLEPERGPTAQRHRPQTRTHRSCYG